MVDGAILDDDTAHNIRSAVQNILTGTFHQNCDYIVVIVEHAEAQNSINVDVISAIPFEEAMQVLHMLTITAPDNDTETVN